MSPDVFREAISSNAKLKLINFRIQVEPRNYNRNRDNVQKGSSKYTFCTIIGTEITHKKVLQNIRFD